MQAELGLSGAAVPGFDEVLTPDALEFVAELQHRFGAVRRALLEFLTIPAYDYVD